MEQRRLKIEIHGAVQGVGFRPFVYRLATDLALGGWVINDTEGVFIEVEGPDVTLRSFLERIPAEKPPRAIIHSLESSWIAPCGEQQFTIRHSATRGAKTVLVLPEIATCADCLAEIGDPANRRYRYAFTNCTNCGPRFTIIEALPYDRPNTTMRRFAFCADCAAEYADPRDRRFHAQPNACPLCGPQLELWERSADRESAQDNAPGAPGHRVIARSDEALCQAAAALRAGQVVAVKGLGGFHLMVDAGDAAAVAGLREHKPRRDKPFALMARDLDQVRALCVVSPEAAALLTAPEAPIVLLRHQANAADAVAENVAPGNPNLGIMLPATPLHHLLLRELSGPVVATSGNLSDEPICTDEYEALERLGHIADLFLVHNRPITRHVDDSVVWMQSGEARLLRRARGYAPLPVLLPEATPTILAVGAHLKNTVALSVQRQVFISQHIGDLETPEAMAAFERVIADFLRLYEAAPLAIAHDMHPDYLSSHWARRWSLDVRDQIATDDALAQSPLARIEALVPVQHHHAHLAACLAENGAVGPALGVIWDGTGYGSDGTVWGGEFLLGDARHFRRVAHLRPFQLPGGEAAVKEPRRVALALSWELCGAAALERDDLAPIRAFRPTERRLLGQMLDRGVNAPVTTSAGRLFDGVAALLGLHQRVSFEGQAAMALEWIADPTVAEAYPVDILATGVQPAASDETTPSFVVDWRSLLTALLEDLRRGVAVERIAACFHNALVELIVQVAQLAGEPQVALSGGCFQNRWLTERAAQQLRQAGFTVLLHRQVPPNDGGISLGQVAVAAAQLAGRT
jgi:hydrogenase maturation protein HypF